MDQASLPPRSLLFVPASRPRMIEKAAALAADLIVLDLEDAVAEADKHVARVALPGAIAHFGGRPVAVRINGAESACQSDDLAAASAAGAAMLVVPKVEDAESLASVAGRAGLPLLAMIETPRGVLRLPRLAATPGLRGLIVGTNDLSAELRLPPAAGRGPLLLSLQAVVLAARAHGLWAIDGVCNALGDAEALAAETREGRQLGFDGKSLIHPEQVEIANRLFRPSDAEIAEAEALVRAASGGAERFAGRLVEDLHVRAARALLARAAS